ncbi:MAG: cytochrome c oxidase subunit 3 [Acidobacteriaceae bacterium]
MPHLTSNPRSVSPSNGGRGVPPPLPHGGGGGGGGGRGDDRQPDYGWKLRRYRLGLAFALVSISLLFVTLTVCFLLLKNGNHYDASSGHFVSSWLPIPIPLRLLLFNTVILLVSSLTLERARRLARLESILVPATQIPGITPIAQNAIRWVQATAILGLGFLLGQLRAWQWFRARDIFSASGPASSFAYFLTGTHAVHLLGGIAVLGYACLAPGPRHSLDRRRIAIDVTTFYWHFMSLLWIYVLGLLWYFGNPLG